MSGINRARGETGLIISGKMYALCLTLGALACIETSLKTNSLDELSDRLRHLGAKDVLAVLSALLIGGGNPLSDEDLLTLNVDPTKAAMAIAEAFSLAMQDL